VKNILVVEDSVTVLNAIVEEFKNYSDMTPITATTYKDALAILRSKKYIIDFAILDLTLPDSDGNKIVSLALSHKIPPLVLTASLNTSLRDLIFGREVFDYILKNGDRSITYAVKRAHDYVKKYSTTILVVDDSLMDRMRVTEILKDIEVNILEASDGEEALKIINEPKNNVTVAIIDFKMPNMDGLELCMKIRADYNKDNFSIIGISSNSDTSIVDKFIKAGANDFILKPCRMNDLLLKTRANLELLELFKRTKDMANRDFLTGMFNRRYFFDAGTLILNKEKRKNEPVALAMVDIDKFKNINDEHGHLVGDIAIKEVKRIFDKVLRKSDLFARFGGEEFCILIDNIMLDDVKMIFETIRNEFETNMIDANGTTISYTVSIGIYYGIGTDNETLDDLVHKADNALYEAKDGGRNRFIIHT